MSLCTECPVSESSYKQLLCSAVRQVEQVYWYRVERGRAAAAHPVIYIHPPPRLQESPPPPITTHLCGRYIPLPTFISHIKSEFLDFTSAYFI